MRQAGAFRTLRHRWGGRWAALFAVAPMAFGGCTAEAQTGVDGSTLELYRNALRLRREWMQTDEVLEWMDVGEDVIAFRRGSGVVCVANYGEPALALPEGQVLVSSEEIVDGLLPGNSTCWLAGQ